MQLLFLHPTWLLALLALPLLALLLWQRAQAAKVALRAFATHAAWLRWGIAGRDGRAKSRGLLVLIALASLLVALAEPRLAKPASPSAPLVAGGTLVVALDLSRSMRTEDMGGRSRLLEATRLAAAILPAFQGWRVAVLGFAGEAITLIPPTTDHRAVGTLLAAAAPGQAPGVGTNIENGLDASIQVLRRPGPKALLLLSDGEQLSGDMKRSFSQLKALGPALGVVGVGTPAGGRISLPSEAFGEANYLMHGGAEVISRLEDKGLKALAEEGHGRYWRMADGLMPAELSRHLGQGASVNVAPALADAWPIFMLPLLMAFLALMAEMILSWWPLNSGRWVWRSSQWARAGKAMALLLMWPFLPGFDDPRAWWTNAQAQSMADQGASQSAIDAYRRAVNAFPDAWAMHHNLGRLVYEAGQHREAANHFRRAYDLAPPQAQGRIAYQLGNALFRMAESEGDPVRYRHAIEEYQRSLKADPKDADAQANLALAQARLKQAQNKAQGSPPPPSTGGQGGPPGQGGGFGGPGFAVGSNAHYTPAELPKTLPSAEEVAARLAFLEQDESLRQAEAGEAAAARAARAREGSLADALRQFSQEKDW